MGIKGVILAAGYGTRFLPVTRCIPKEMLPIIDRPAIDFVVQEMADAGLEQVVLITSRRKRVLDDWFDHDVELETVFRAQGASRKLEKSRPPRIDVAFVRQQEMRGSGHAILQAAHLLKGEPFVVAYPDDLFGEPNCTAQLVETWHETGATVLAAHDLPGADLTRYGVLDVETSGGQLLVKRLVEKPPAGQAPSTLVSLGRYLYSPDFLDALAEGWERHDPASGEYYPMEATNTLAAAGRVMARVVESPRWDTGEPLGFLKTVTEVALAREDIGPAYAAWLRERLGG
jgi:UTP--glucose-1-phosphate uridylyltransferase